jgi:hypothetical protein
MYSGGTPTRFGNADTMGATLICHFTPWEFEGWGG